MTIQLNKQPHIFSREYNLPKKEQNHQQTKVQDSLSQQYLRFYSIHLVKGTNFSSNFQFFHCLQGKMK